MSETASSFDAGLFTDVKVDVAGIQFSLHRARLANASRTFEDLLKAHEGQGSIILRTLPGGVPAFVLALEWIYRDYVKKHLQQLDCPVETLTAVLACADYLHIQDLMTAAENHLTTVVNQATWATMLKSAQGFGGHAFDFVCTLVVNILRDSTLTLSSRQLADMPIDVAVGLAAYLAQRPSPAPTSVSHFQFLQIGSYPYVPAPMTYQQQQPQPQYDTCSGFVLRYLRAASEGKRTGADRDKWLQLLQPLEAEVTTLGLANLFDIVLAAVCFTALIVHILTRLRTVQGRFRGGCSAERDSVRYQYWRLGLSSLPSKPRFTNCACIFFGRSRAKPV